MNQITDIEPQKKNPKRVNVFLDGAFAFGISRECKIVNKIQIGNQVSDTEIQRLIFEDQVERLYEKAINFLTYRPRSEKEVRDNLLQKLKLTDKGEEEKKNFQKSIEKVLEKLKKLKFLNDREFTVWWVEQRTKFKKTSPRIIKSELFKKGIAKEMIAETLAEAEIDSFQLALDAAKKKLSSYQKLTPREFREKMGRFLGSKGFDWEVIKKVVDTLAKEE